MKRRWRRILITVGIVVVVCSAYAWFFGLQTVMILETRWMARRSPVVRLTPRPLLDISISTAKGTKLSYFGYDFEVPWDDLDQSKTKLYTSRVVLHFRSGKAMIFSSGRPHEFVDTVLENQNKDANTFRQLYGDEPLQSDYAMHRLILEATPDKVTLLTPRKQAVGIPMLLILKAIAVPEASGMYSIQNKDFKGFQFGDLQRKPRLIVDDLFADDGGVEFVFSGLGKGQPLEQADINRAVQTVHKSANN